VSRLRASETGDESPLACHSKRVSSHTGWRRCIGCLKLQFAFRKRATIYRAVLRKETYKDKASYASLPPCTRRVPYTRGVSIKRLKLQVSFRKRATSYRAFLRVYKTRVVPAWWMSSHTYTRVSCDMYVCHAYDASGMLQVM